MLRLLVPALTLTLAPPALAAAPEGPLPALVVWVWERPEDLRFLDPRETGVAFLSATVQLPEAGGGPREARRPTGVTWRRQPLRVAPGAALLPVVRVESPPHGRAALGAEPIEALVKTAVEAAALPGAVGVQIDSDARRSERAFFRDALHAIRRALPPGRWLSFTALASWCAGDRWIGGLPVDEVVPMLFEMGEDEHAIRRGIRSSGSFLSAVCRGSWGLLAEDRIEADLGSRRVYLFSRVPWTPEGLARARKAVGR